MSNPEETKAPRIATVTTTVIPAEPGWRVEWEENSDSYSHVGETWCSYPVIAWVIGADAEVDAVMVRHGLPESVGASHSPVRCLVGFFRAGDAAEQGHLRKRYGVRRRIAQRDREDERELWANREHGQPSPIDRDPHLAPGLTKPPPTFEGDVEQLPEPSALGDCPFCGLGSYVNVHKNHWGICADHRVKWSIGYGLFSSWQEEDEELWKKNAEMLTGYKEVEPWIRWQHVEQSTDGSQVTF